MENNNIYTFALVLVATLGSPLFGYDTAVISGTVESLREFFIESQRLPLDQTSALEGFMVSSASIGCILDASFVEWISQRYGRKSTLILAAILFLLFAIGSAWPELFIDTPGSGDHMFMCAFMAYRTLGGIGVGLVFTVSPMHIVEVVPTDHWGNLVAWNQFTIIFGMLAVYFVSCTVTFQGDTAWPNTIGRHWMFASKVIPTVLFLSLLMFVPETLRHLVIRGCTGRALTILNRLMDLETAGYELKEIQEGFKMKVPSTKPYFWFMETWLALLLIGYGLLSWAGNMNALEIASLASFCIALLFPIRSFGVLIILVGVLLSGFQQFTGTNVVLYYAPEIFKTMGAATDAALLQRIVVGAVNLLFTVLAIFTVDKFGCYPLMIIGALVMAVSMLVLGATFYTCSVGMGSLVCTLACTVGFVMLWGPVCWVLLAEIFSNSIHSTIMSIVVARQRITNFLVSRTFPTLDKNQYSTDTFNYGMAYWTYGIMGILATLFIWKFVPETKGKALGEMEGYWKR